MAEESIHPVWRGRWQDARIGLPHGYFTQRSIRLDCRGPLYISAKAHLSFDVKVYTATHRVSAKWSEGTGFYTEDVVTRPVAILDHTWVGSEAILYNCIIGEGSIVALGTVVRSVIVPAMSIVAGNPARLVGVWDRTLQEWFGLSGLPLERMTKEAYESLQLHP